MYGRVYLEMIYWYTGFELRDDKCQVLSDVWARLLHTRVVLLKFLQNTGCHGIV